MRRRRRGLLGTSGDRDQRADQEKAFHLFLLQLNAAG
jgi:hypothetical protein